MGARSSNTVAARRGPTPRQRKLIRAKTGGRCHVCGGPVGKLWHADHVIPHYRGGSSDIDNFLPICRECNGLRWAHGPKAMRLILRLGVYARREIKNKTRLGAKLQKLLDRRVKTNGRRRVGSAKSS